MVKKSIELFKVFMSEEAPKAVSETLMSGFIGEGPKVKEFEGLLKDRLNTDYLATANSATSAEHLAFHLLKQFGVVNQGDEVLTTSQTCTATNMPIVHNGLRIKWVDIDPKNINMDLDDLERKISPSTKVIYLTNWGGMPHDFYRIAKILNKTKDKFGFVPFVMQDCAHAFGSRLGNLAVHEYGQLSTFSFQAIKHLTTVDGGMIVANKTWNRAPEFIEQFVLQRWYGIDRNQKRTDFRCEANVEHAGFKFHMNDVNATVGISNLKHIDWILSRHRENAKYYDENLKDVKGLTLLERKPGFDSSFWIYSMLVEERSPFMKMMAEKGIAVSQVHERNDKHTCFSEFKAHLPNLDRTLPHLVNIPVHWGVDKEDREFIVDTIKGGW